MEKAFFIDKDGVLVDNSDYPKIIPTDSLLENNILEGLSHIKSKNYKIIIISNQPWIAEGIIKKEKVEEIFQSLVNKLNEKGIKVDDYFYCPHHPTKGIIPEYSFECDCRKPKPGMVLKAVEKHNIDLKESFLIGDMDKDILLGKSLGIMTILVLTGNGKEFISSNPDYILDDLNKVKEII